MNIETLKKYPQLILSVPKDERIELLNQCISEKIYKPLYYSIFDIASYDDLFKYNKFVKTFNSECDSNIYPVLDDPRYLDLFLRYSKNNIEYTISSILLDLNFSVVNLDKIVELINKNKISFNIFKSTHNDFKLKLLDYMIKNKQKRRTFPQGNEFPFLPNDRNARIDFLLKTEQLVSIDPMYADFFGKGLSFYLSPQNNIYKKILQEIKALSSNVSNIYFFEILTKRKLDVNCTRYILNELLKSESDIKIPNTFEKFFFYKKDEKAPSYVFSKLPNFFEDKIGHDLQNRIINYFMNSTYYQYENFMLISKCLDKEDVFNVIKEKGYESEKFHFISNNPYFNKKEYIDQILQKSGSMLMEYLNINNLDAESIVYALYATPSKFTHAYMWKHKLIKEYTASSPILNEVKQICETRSLLNLTKKEAAVLIREKLKNGFNKMTFSDLDLEF